VDYLFIRDGGAAATLTGLVFVAVSINLSRVLTVLGGGRHSGSIHTGSSQYRILAITPIRGHGSWSEDRFRGGGFGFSHCPGWFADGEVGGGDWGSTCGQQDQRDRVSDQHPGVKLRRSGPSRGSILFVGAPISRETPEPSTIAILTVGATCCGMWLRSRVLRGTK
jgi:hypothetical protein